MNNTEYNRLRQKIEGKYQKTLKLAEKQRKEALDALEQVWSMFHNIDETITSIQVKLPLSKTKNSYGSLTVSVKEAIKLIPSNKFTKKDIRLVLPQISAEIASSCKDASLTGCLYRLEKQGIIKTAKKGRGSIPTVYKKIA